MCSVSSECVQVFKDTWEVRLSLILMAVCVLVIKWRDPVITKIVIDKKIIVQVNFLLARPLPRSKPNQIYLPRTILSLTYFIHLPMKMEPIVSSETSTIRTQTPGNYAKRNKLHINADNLSKMKPADIRGTRRWNILKVLLMNLKKTNNNIRLLLGHQGT